jgi:hypothetical protein
MGPQAAPLHAAAGRLPVKLQSKARKRRQADQSRRRLARNSESDSRGTAGLVRRKPEGSTRKVPSGRDRARCVERGKPSRVRRVERGGDRVFVGGGRRWIAWRLVHTPVAGKARKHGRVPRTGRAELAATGPVPDVELGGRVGREELNVPVAIDVARRDSQDGPSGRKFENDLGLREPDEQPGRRLDPDHVANAVAIEIHVEICGSSPGGNRQQAKEHQTNGNRASKPAGGHASAREYSREPQLQQMDTAAPW